MIFTPNKVEGIWASLLLFCIRILLSVFIQINTHTSYVSACVSVCIHTRVYTLAFLLLFSFSLKFNTTPCGQFRAYHASLSLSLSHSTHLLKSLFCAFAFACPPICIDLGWRFAANCKSEQFKWEKLLLAGQTIYPCVCVCVAHKNNNYVVVGFFWLFLFRLFALLLHFCFWLFSALPQLLRSRRRRRRCCRCYLIFTFFFIFGITWLYKHTDTRMYIHTYVHRFVCVC